MMHPPQREVGEKKVWRLRKGRNGVGKLGGTEGDHAPSLGSHEQTQHSFSFLDCKLLWKRPVDRVHDA